MNLIGEHTDYNSGFCLPACIEQSIYIGISPARSTEIVSLDRNEKTGLNSDNPPQWFQYFKAVSTYLQNKNIEVPPFHLSFGGDLPYGAGLSSSSAICCGFLTALNHLFEWNFTKEALTSMAVEAEKLTGVIGGMMDQICIMHAKKDHALLIDCSSWKYEHFPANLKEYNYLIIDTKVKHQLLDTDYNNRSAECRSIREILLLHSIIKEHIAELAINDLVRCQKMLNERQFSFLQYIIAENDRVKKFVTYLRENRISEAGKLLFEGHKGLRYEYLVSCKELDFLVDWAEKSDSCLGARMMGGGFGGSTVHLVSKEDTSDYIRDISKAYKAEMGFEPQCIVSQLSDGIQIL